MESAAADVAPRFECSSSKCACRHFFFVVAEGAWILRCRCKHKHIEHDSSAAPHRCLKLKCSCAEFDRYVCFGFNAFSADFYFLIWDSPWVCNCGHAWNSHAQSVYKKQRAELTPSMMSGCDALPDMAVELINELDLNYRKDGSS